MRYSLSISLSQNQEKLSNFDFSKSVLAEELLQHQSIIFGNSISVSTAHYDRKVPGLVEANWSEPYFDNEKIFLFIGGYIITRNDYVKEFGDVPSPKLVADFLYSGFAEDLYQKFKGNYYILYFDKEQNTVQVFSAPLVIHPVFYTFKEGVIQFSNFMGAFSDVNIDNVNKKSLVEFVLFDHTLANSTLYTNVFTCMGGEQTIFYQDRIERKIIYDLVKWYTIKPLSRKKALPRIKDALRKSIDVYLSKTKEFNSSLTGGFDGRLNLALIPKDRYQDTQAISYGIKGSSNINIPIKITQTFNIKHKPIYLDQDFENQYSDLGLKSIYLTGGHTGFHRAMYPYAYSIMSNYSRSCILGQCDMIRPLYTNPAGIVFNEPSRSVFFGTYQDFIIESKKSLSSSIIKIDNVEDEILKSIYEEIQSRYITPYSNLNNKLSYYFYLYKEGLVKFWQTEFHLVDIFIDDYVSFADLDYLELLFSSKYAGIYKGLLADNQASRRRGQDLYVDLMTLNNNKLNSFLVDRGYKPKWLKFGYLGWAFSGAIKIIKSKLKKEKDDTFRSNRWTSIWIKSNKDLVMNPNKFFDLDKIKEKSVDIPKEKELHTFVRALSLKVWLDYRR
jgi:hypothetical protein